MTDRSLDFVRVFSNDARLLVQAREKAIQIHAHNIRSAGDEVEVSVREYLKRMLPPRYHVTSGHLIDHNGRTSPHFDVVISDHFNMPSLLTTQDGTEYIPASSALVIGEVKSTYYNGKNYFQKFSDDLKVVHSTLERPLIKNTSHGGISTDTLLSDVFTASPKKYHNELFTFFLCIDAGDLQFKKIAPILKSSRIEHLPSMAVFLNAGLVCLSNRDGKEMAGRIIYPSEVGPGQSDWCFVPMVKPQGGSIEGATLSVLYGDLIQHLYTSQIGSPNAYKYTKSIFVGLKTTLTWLGDVS